MLESYLDDFEDEQRDRYEEKITEFLEQKEEEHVSSIPNSQN